MAETEYSLGVDIGTSNTVAVLRNAAGITRPLLFDGQPILPSTVYLDDDSGLLVGQDAQRMAQLDPTRCEPNPKRRIGDTFVLLGDREVPVARLLAALFIAVGTKAVEVAGQVPPATVTHPAGWGSTRRAVLLEAVRLAGWPPPQLVPEPVAAARYFARVLRRPVPVGGSIAVFDFGGGTLDVAVLRNNPDRGFQVAGYGGDEAFGGLDLDAAVVAGVGELIGTRHPEIWQHLTHPVDTADRRYRRLFWEDVRGAKEMLTRTATAPLPVPGVNTALHLTRDEFEQRIRPLLDRAVDATAAVIDQAGTAPRQLAALFLVGGSSRVPLVARQLHARLGIAPVVLEQPELPVAEGAVIPDEAPAHAASDVPSGAAGRPVPLPPPPRRHWYRRRRIIVPAAAAVVALVVAGFLLSRNLDEERPFITLHQVATVKYQQQADIGWVAIDGSDAVTVETSGGGSADKAQLSVMPLTATKPTSRHTLTAPNGQSWDWWQADGDVMLLHYQIDGTHGSGVVAYRTDGTKLWSATDDPNGGDDESSDWSLLPKSPVAFHYDEFKSALIAYDKTSGEKLWSRDSIGLPWPDHGPGDYQGPSSFGYPRAENENDQHSDDVVVISSDSGTASVVDETSGKVLGRRHVAGNTAFTVYNGVLYEATSTLLYTVSAYSLDHIGGKALWRTTGPDDHAALALSICASSLLCVAEDPSDGEDSVRPANQLAAYSLSDGTREWAVRAAKVGWGIPVGDRIVLTYQNSSGSLQTEALDENGTIVTRWPGEAARIDDASVLVSSGDVDAFGESRNTAGLSLAGDGVQQAGQQTSIGKVPQELSACDWNDKYLVCPDDTANQFVVSRFRT